MGKTTQRDRLLSIATPLGPDYLLLNKIHAEERISELFNFEIELVYDEEEDNSYEMTIVDPADIVGQTVSVGIVQDDGGKRTLTGMVNNFTLVGRNRRFTFYNATVVPHVWKLTRNFQSRIFQHKSVIDILKEVFEDFEVKFQTQGTYEPRNYCVQYQESDFDFASRLMEEEGIYYYFDHASEMEKMIIRDDFKSPEDCPTKSDIPIVNEDLTGEIFESAIKRWQTDYKLQNGKVTMWDYHFQLPKKKLEVEKESSVDVGGNKTLEVYRFPAGYARKYDDIDKSGGERSDLVKVFQDNKKTVGNRLTALDAQYKNISGMSDCCTLTPGYRFQLKNHPNREFNIKYILLSVRHDAEQSPDYIVGDTHPNAYINEFTCIPQGAGSPEFRPALKTPKPIVYGSQTAVVVGPPGEEIFTDKYGRVKVQFHWDRQGKYDSDSACWLRVGQAWAGNRWGAMFIPRVGHEVIVHFLEGDPDQPIIVGSVYNPETMPHYELPKYKTLSYYKSRTSPDDGKGFNEWRFEDKQGKEQVFIHSQKRMDVRVRESLYETCGGNRQELIGMRTDNQPGGNLAVSVGGNHDFHVKYDEFIGIDGKRNETVKGDVVEDYQSNLSTVVGTNAELNAKEITLEGSMKITLRVGTSFITLDPSGVTIAGAMVKINSGGTAAGTGFPSIDEPLDAEPADTGEPGYLDRPRSGGGPKKRKSRVLTGNHLPPVKQNADGTFQVGKNIKVKGSPEFMKKALKDLSILGSTQTGSKVMAEIDKGKHQTTIEELDMATARINGATATPDDGDAAAQTPGVGSPATVKYNPDLKNDQYFDKDGNPVDMPVQATEGHELIHALHFSRGTDRNNLPEAAETGSTEEESQTIGIHGHENGDNDDGLTQNNLLKDMGEKIQRKNHGRKVEKTK